MVSCHTPCRQTATRSTCSWPTRARSCRRRHQREAHWGAQEVDDAGRDEKILAVPTPKLTKRYEHVTNYTNLPRISLEQVQHLFEHYKDLEPGKWVKMGGWGDAEEARQLTRAAIARAAQQRGKPPPKYAWTLQAARCATKGGGTTRPGAQHDAHPPFPCASSRADPCPRSDRSAL